MPTAIVLLKIDHRKVTGTAEKLLDIRDISEVYSVSGRYDLLVIIKCESLDKMEYVITDQLLKTDGIARGDEIAVRPPASDEKSLTQKLVDPLLDLGHRCRQREAESRSVNVGTREGGFALAEMPDRRSNGVGRRDLLG